LGRLDYFICHKLPKRYFNVKGFLVYELTLRQSLPADVSGCAVIRGYRNVLLPEHIAQTLPSLSSWK